MPTISLSPQLVSGNTTSIASRIFQPAAGTNSILDSLLSIKTGSGSGSGTWIYIMKGVMPSDLTTITAFSQRSADVLGSLQTSTSTAGDFAPSTTSTTPVVLTSIYAAATAAGTATWFWYVNRASLFGTANGEPLLQQIAGSIGAVGSGKDLEIGNTSITVGQQIRIFNLRFSFPTSFSY